MSGTVVLVAKINEKIISSRLCCHGAARVIIQFYNNNIKHIEDITQEVELSLIDKPSIVYNYEDFVSEGLIEYSNVIDDINYYILGKNVKDKKNLIIKLN